MGNLVQEVLGLTSCSCCKLLMQWCKGNAAIVISYQSHPWQCPMKSHYKLQVGRLDLLFPTMENLILSIGFQYKNEQTNGQTDRTDR